MPPPNTPEEGVPDVNAPPVQDSASSESASFPQANAPDQLNFQALEYVDPVDQELICPICRDPLVNPYTTICEHTFCFGCLHDAWTTSHTCPTDRTQLCYPKDICRAAKIVRNQLGNLRVRCPNSVDGCDKTLCRSEVEEHVAKHCAFTPVDCPADNCARKITRRDAEKGQCLHFNIPCDFCGRYVECLSMQSHVEHDCPKSHQSCQHCGLKFPRSALGHHKSECHEALVSCKHASLGCPTTARRKELAAHLQSCPYSLLEKLGALVAKQQDQINELQRRDRDRERRLKSLEFEHLQSPYAEYSRTKTAPSSAIPEDGLLDEALRSNSAGGGVPPPFESMDQYLLSLYESSEAKMDIVQKSLSDLEGRQTVMLLNETMPIKEQMAEMRSQLGVQGMHVRWLMNFRLQERSRNMATVSSIMGALEGTGTGPSPDPCGDGDDGRGLGRRLSDSIHPPRL